MRIGREERASYLFFSLFYFSLALFPLSETVSFLDTKELAAVEAYPPSSLLSHVKEFSKNYTSAFQLFKLSIFERDAGKGGSLGSQLKNRELDIIFFFFISKEWLLIISLAGEAGACRLLD